MKIIKLLWLLIGFYLSLNSNVFSKNYKCDQNILPLGKMHKFTKGISHIVTGKVLNVEISYSPSLGEIKGRPISYTATVQITKI